MTFLVIEITTIDVGPIYLHLLAGLASQLVVATYLQPIYHVPTYLNKMMYDD